MHGSTDAGPKTKGDGGRWTLQGVYFYCLLPRPVQQRSARGIHGYFKTETLVAAVPIAPKASMFLYLYFFFVLSYCPLVAPYGMRAAYKRPVTEVQGCAYSAPGWTA